MMTKTTTTTTTIWWKISDGGVTATLWSYCSPTTAPSATAPPPEREQEQQQETEMETEMESKVESGEDAQAVFDAALRAVSKSRATLASGDWCGPSFSSAACASEKNYSE